MRALIKNTTKFWSMPVKGYLENTDTDNMLTLTLTVTLTLTIISHRIVTL